MIMLARWMKLLRLAVAILLIPVAAFAQAPVSPGPPTGAPQPSIVPTELTMAQAGFAARYWRPSGAARGVAVLVLNGSDGGYPRASLARSLAGAGHPVLALAYFSGENGPEIPGLPRRLKEIPLEYFYRAIDWLRAETGGPVALMGESRGAELALLLGTRRPDLAGIIAFAPGTAVWQAPTFSLSEPVHPAWLEGGRPLPFLSGETTAGLTSNERFDRVLARGAGAARIPIERVRAPVLLVAGGADRIWSSLSAANEIAAAARRAGRPRVTLLTYRDAGHLLMGPGPGLSRFEGPGFVVEFGGTDASNLAARTDAWQKTLHFLERLGGRERRRRPPSTN